MIKGSKYIVFGRNFSAGRQLWLEAVVNYQGQHFRPRIEIGDEVAVSDNVHLTCINYIAIRKHVLIGSKVYIADHNHGLYSGTEQSHPALPPAARRLGGGPVEIGENAWIGDNVTIIGPAIIGEGAILAANSVITRDVQPRTIVAGAPARVVKRYRTETSSWENVERQD